MTLTRQKEASLGNAHHPIASIRSTGDVPLNPTPSDFPSLALTPHPKLILGRLRRSNGFLCKKRDLMRELRSDYCIYI